jgi:tripartite-type tricarboxylate transporter receptor subunit TctC
VPISRRTLLATASLVPAAALISHPARAAYPDRPIRLIVPFAPGGNADIVARLVGERMAEALGQPVIIDNRAGAGGSLGAAEVARANPDGYTLLSGSNGPLTVNPFVQAKLAYDPLKDFIPIGLTSLAPHALIVNPSVPAKSVAEIVALSKQQPVNIGTSGVGSASHMTLERFNAATGAKLTHVPYRSGGAIMPDLIGGAIHGAMSEFSAMLALHRDGKARFIAIAAPKRSSLAPEVPTMIESGVKDFTAASYIGLLAPAGTPAPIVDQLQKALAKALAAEALQKRMGELGIELATPDLMTAAGFSAFLKDEYERTREAAQFAGLKKE